MFNEYIKGLAIMLFHEKAHLDNSAPLRLDMEYLVFDPEKVFLFKTETKLKEIPHSLR